MFYIKNIKKYLFLGIFKNLRSYKFTRQGNKVSPAGLKSMPFAKQTKQLNIIKIFIYSRFPFFKGQPDKVILAGGLRGILFGSAFFLAIGFLFFLPAPTHAADINVSGNINSDTVWLISNNYIVSEIFIVSELSGICE